MTPALASTPPCSDTPGTDTVPIPLLLSLAEAHDQSPRPIDGLVIGILSGLSPDGVPQITLHAHDLPEHIEARAICPIGPERINTQCALMFEQGNPRRPVIMGFLHQPVAPIQSTTAEVTADGRRITFDAQDEIVLRAGKASLTLRSDGRVEVRGATVVTHATGLNRIRGASVKLN